jgi:hypothetical protein
MARTNALYANELAGQQAGYNGGFGDGSFQRWLDAQANKTGFQNNFSTITGSTQGPSAGYNPLLSTLGNYPGVKPVGVIEPLNQFERNAITAVTSGAPTSAAIPGVQGNIDAIRGATDYGNVNTAMSTFFNPYIDQVVNQSQQDVQRARDLLQPSLNQQANMTGSFGDKRFGVANAEADRNAIEQSSRISAQLRAQGFSDATANALSLISQQQGGAANAAQLGISAATQGQNNFLTGQNAALQAGGVARGVNQSVLDATQRERELLYADPSQRINQYAQTVGGYPMGQSTTSYGPQQNPIQGAIGGGLFGSSLYDAYKGSGGGLLSGQTAASNASLYNTGYNPSLSFNNQYASLR